MKKNDLIEHMVNRFLGWKLPKDFAPDCGIAIDRETAERNHWPTGTNIFHAKQAQQMFEYCLENAPDEPAAQEPVFWYRPRSDGGYEGPIYNSQIEDVRKNSGAWIGLHTHPAPEAVRKLPRLTRYEVFCAMGKIPLQSKVTDDFILSVANAVMDKMEAKAATDTAKDDAVRNLVEAADRVVRGMKAIDSNLLETSPSFRELEDALDAVKGK